MYVYVYIYTLTYTYTYVTCNSRVLWRAVKIECIELLDDPAILLSRPSAVHSNIISRCDKNKNSPVRSMKFHCASEDIKQI